MPISPYVTPPRGGAGGAASSDDLITRTIEDPVGQPVVYEKAEEVITSMATWTTLANFDSGVSSAFYQILATCRASGVTNNVGTGSRTVEAYADQSAAVQTNGDLTGSNHNQGSGPPQFRWNANVDGTSWDLQMQGSDGVNTFSGAYHVSVVLPGNISWTIT